MPIGDADRGERLVGEPLASILENFADAVFVIDARGFILWVNATIERMFGWRRDEMVGRNIAVFMPSPLKEEVEELLVPSLSEEGLARILGVNRWLDAKRKDGARVQVEVGIAPFVQEGRRFFAGFVRDVGARRAMEDKLQYLASHDQVTGLANLRSLLAAAKKALAAATPCALVAVELVGLYRIGERHGRAGGEHVIKTVARRLTEIMDGGGLLARFEGELFAILTEDPEPEALATRLCAAACQPIPWGTIELHLRVAAGVARAANDARKDGRFHSADDMLQAAHAAARDALARHVPCAVSLFTPDIGRRLKRQALLEERLRAAVAADGLSLALQAKVRASDGRILGAEALVRWDDDLLGSVPPSEFIPLAERSGIIGDLDAWVRRRCLAEAVQWQRAGLDLSIAFNVSAVELRQPGLAHAIREAIAASGCDPARVVIELTESAVAEDPGLAAAQLRAMKDLGASVSLDDFGTGYSSLSSLRRFPIDTLKIDQSFVADTPHDADAVAIVGAIVALARRLGLETVAEGVETSAQAAFLRDLGVDVLQGYLYSRPVAPDTFTSGEWRDDHETGNRPQEVRTPKNVGG